MDDSQDTDVGFSFTADDVLDPLAWIEKLSMQSLKRWLRFALWTRHTLPVIVPPNSRFALDLAGLLKNGSPELKARIRSLIPNLLQEWGRDDLSITLDDLLVLSGRLRCAAAEPTIGQIANERLRGRLDEILLRQRCLSVLSGFGCTDRSEFIFKKYINDIEYTATCYRALYRFDLTYAGTELPLLCSVFRDADAIDELDVTLKTLFRDLGTSTQSFEVLAIFLAKSEPESFPDVFETLRGIGAITINLFLKATYNQRVELFRSLLERGHLEDFKGILWGLKSIGIELHLSESEDEQEYLKAVYEDPNSDLKKSESLFTTDNFSDELIAAIIESSEDVAVAWAATTPERWELN